MGRILQDLWSLAKLDIFTVIMFWNGVWAYFALEAHKNPNEIWSTFIKLAPMTSLILSLWFKPSREFKLRNLSYLTQILMGLMCCAYGDALLNHQLLHLGMLLFATGHVCYITAFGWKPVELWIGQILYTFGGAVVYILWGKLDFFMQICLPIYTIILTTMCWRALAVLCLNDNVRKVEKIVAAVSACLFVISDAILAFDKFNAPIENGSYWIMIPYYAAQYGFAASTRDLDKEKAAKELEKPEDKTPKPAQPSCSTNPPNKKKRK